MGDYENRSTPTIISSLLPRYTNTGNPSSKDLIKRQKSSNDLMKPDAFNNNDIMMKRNFEASYLLQQDEKIVEIACGTLHSLIKTSIN